MGASLYDGSNIVFFPAHKVSAVDVTSAGDVFTAALALKYTADKDIENAVRYANIAGALTVTKLGAMKSIPTKKDVDRAIAEC
jgi:ribokinase